MNISILMGRLTRDPEIRYTQGDNPIAVSHYTLAVDRRFTKDGTTDFIPCVAFGNAAGFSEKYFRKGMKVLVTGRIHTSSYINKDKNKVMKTEIYIEEQEFCESKQKENSPTITESDSGFDLGLPDLEEEAIFK